MKPLAVHWLVLGLAALTQGAGRAAVVPAVSSQVVEATGLVECRPLGARDWVVATNGLALHPGDQLRTGAQSRSAVQFSDRSVLRLGERTTLEVQPPKHAERQRFGLLRGLLFFFHRDGPSDVEFETPLSSGSIRGTEFVLEADEGNGATQLALLDGQVELTALGTILAVSTGEAAQIEPGQPPRKTALLDARRLVQWALYYPGVVWLEDLGLSAEDRALLAPTLEAYGAGDILAAHAAMRNVPQGDQRRELFRAALELAVGQVNEASRQIDQVGGESGVSRALRELVDVVRGTAGLETNSPAGPLPTTASELLARSYLLQAQYRLKEAREAATRVVALAPEFGFAHARLAELEWALERRRSALDHLDRALRLAPRLASAHATRGFMCLESHDVPGALSAFEQAIQLDAALGNAWLGRGLAQLRSNQRGDALRSLQTAAALEPTRAIYRSYLGKAWSQNGETALADREFRLAKGLDPNDPTAWFYAALHAGQQNRPNVAVRDLEQSVARNDNLRLFHSRLGLDRDRAVRSANLAALYRDAGLTEVSVRSASQAVAEDYANYSGHLFLANSYQLLEDPLRYELRLETARQSEWLTANLLAPAGAANLSQLLSQQEHLQFFDPRRLGLSSYTEYRSSGDWRQQASLFGAENGLSYALDVAYDRRHGTEVNDVFERTDVSLQFKQRLTRQDDLYAQFGFADSEAGDVAQRYDPATANPGLRVDEQQLPNLVFGWHRSWTPGSHTLLLVSRHSDSLKLANPDPSVLFLRQIGGAIADVSTPPLFDLWQDSDFTLYSAELQQLWQGERLALVGGGRFQAGDVSSHAILDRTLSGRVSDQVVDESLQRGNVYAYAHWHPLSPLRLTAGLAYDHLTFPANTELPPLATGNQTRDLVSPKAGFLLTPWTNGLIRGAFTRSLGGLFFDNSVRLEPTQVAGFNQAYRSLLPASVAGLVPGTDFETFHLSLDQSWRSRTYAGVEAEWLGSSGDRVSGALTNSLVVPVPDSPTSTRQSLDYRERSLGAYVVQLLGEGWSVGARYRLTDAKYDTRFPEIPPTAGGVDELEAHASALLHRVAVDLSYQHPLGFFAQWESSWYHQENRGEASLLAGDDFWQHNMWAGWRVPRRRAEIRVGLLNIADADYRLYPLTAYDYLPRHRTFMTSLRLNF